MVSLSICACILSFIHFVFLITAQTIERTLANKVLLYSKTECVVYHFLLIGNFMLWWDGCHAYCYTAYGDDEDYDNDNAGDVMTTTGRPYHSFSHSLGYCCNTFA